jgi:hypothetical protein
MRKSINIAKGKKRNFEGFKIAKLLFAAVLLALFAYIVHAATFDFSPNIDGTTFNLSEDSMFEYDLNVTVNESLITFSSNSKDLGFDVFFMHNSSGLINFTPLNSDVGFYSLTIIGENISDDTDKVTMTVRFNVSNTNDPPNITSYYPEQGNLSVYENFTLSFNYTSSDEDVIHGDVLNTSWYLDDVLVSSNLTFNYTPSFCEAGIHNLTLVINDTLNANDTQSWNITVNNTNRIPTLNATLINRTWNEDTNLTDNITLINITFSDPDILECINTVNRDTLNFSSIGNNSIKISINETTSNVTFWPAQNFFGNETIYFTASDGTNTTFSNNITLFVLNVNDAPELNYTNQSIGVEVLLIYDLNATDPDNEIEAGINNLTYFDNTSIFAINSLSGIINFTPDSGDIGFHPINISVYDGQINASFLVYFNISANGAPNITFIGNKNATEGTYFMLNVTVTDPDADNITLIVNYSRLDVHIINATTFNLSFLPQQSDISNQTVKLTATDSLGASTTEIFNLTIINVNNNPNLTTILNQTLRTDKEFNLFIHANDLDLDNLTFYENASFFNFTYVNISAAFINFTPDSSDEGVHVINISAADPNVNDSQIVTFTINNNTAPNLSVIGNFTFPEDSLFTLRINATDADNDAVLFYANTTLFSLTVINQTSVLINFTPNQNETGGHWINFSVNDTPLVDYELVFFNITFVNDTPYFNPPLGNLTSNATIRFFYDVNASDEEGDILFFEDNSTIFDINNQTGIINFTPTVGQGGNYSVNISVNDGFNVNSTIITFTVALLNRAPNITSYSPLNLANLSMAERIGLQFNVTANDPDDDLITYSWELNGTQKSTAQNFTFEPGFSDAGYYNFSIVVSDGALYDLVSWNLTINNTNRLPVYGLLNHTDESEFILGSAYQINLTAESGNLTLSKSDGVNYFSIGNFSSEKIDLLAGSNLTLINISWKEARPQNTSITFQISTSRDNVTYTNFTGNSSINYTNPNGTAIAVQSDRYIQLRAILETNNSNVSPTIEYVILKYGISDFYGNEDTVYLNFIDLDDYFTDLDSEDTITYNASDVSNIELSIDSQNRLSLTPDSDFFGTRTVVFTASDSHGNVTVNISLNLADVAEPSGSSAASSSGGGGGGGGSRSSFIFINRTILVNISKSYELIVPQSVRAGLNEEIIIPIKIKNNENFNLSQITFSGESNISGTLLFFTPSKIDRIASNTEESVNLVVRAPNISTDFFIRVFANVANPQINDSAIISISVLENVSARISYVRDFIKLNPDCLELHEILEKATLEVKNHNYGSAITLLDNALESCKYLISAGKLDIQRSEEFPLYSRVIGNPYTILIGAILGFIILLTISYAIYNRLKWY